MAARATIDDKYANIVANYYNRRVKQPATAPSHYCDRLTCNEIEYQARLGVEKIFNFTSKRGTGSSVGYRGKRLSRVMFM
jgi:hypothetical protein